MKTESLMILFTAIWVAGLTLIITLSVSNSQHNSKQHDIEMYTAYDILYLQKVKTVWIVSSETVPFYLWVADYYEGVKLIEALSHLDVDDYGIVLKQSNIDEYENNYKLYEKLNL